MTIELALGLLGYVLVVGLVGDRVLRVSRWARRWPAHGLRLWVVLATSSVMAGLATLMLFAHDVLEHFLMWAVHAGKPELHAAYAGPGATDPTWNVAAVLAAGLLGLAVATLVVEVTQTARVRRRLRRSYAAARSRYVAGRHVLVTAGTTPYAFCVPGRRSGGRSGGRSRQDRRGPGVVAVWSWRQARGAIVISEALEQALSEDELAAAVEHEVGHLVGAHHRWILAADVLGRFLGRVGLMTSLRSEVRLLAELEADDRATDRAGARALARALLATAEAGMRSAQSVRPVLGLGENAVGARVERLLCAVAAEDEASQGRRMRTRVDHVARIGVGLTLAWLAAPVLVAGPVVAVLLPGLLLRGSAH